MRMARMTNFCLVPKMIFKRPLLAARVAPRVDREARERQRVLALSELFVEYFLRLLPLC